MVLDDRIPADTRETLFNEAVSAAPEEHDEMFSVPLVKVIKSLGMDYDVQSWMGWEASALVDVDGGGGRRPH